ncbi:MAG: Ig-like domain-containing protein [Planctomycetes bacterium]|nr:Ig-like domain-containing protein [Planctomycetota bacterium]
MDIETTPGAFNGAVASYFYDSASSYRLIDSYYPANGLQMTLTLRPLHNNRKVVPSDLQSLAMNDPVMIQRFKNLLDWIFTQIPNVQLTSLVISSEFDVNLGTDASKWAQYRAFHQAVSAYAKTKRAGLKIAAEATWDGLVGFAQANLIQLNQDCDYIGVSYYGIGANFAAKSMAQVSADIDQVVALYTKPMCLYQFGYPSSTVLGGSEALQRDFITTAFASWDTHANRILMMDFTWLHDMSPQAVQDSMAYFGGASPRFGEFLGTLGLRTWSGAGTDKLSFPELRHQARARGWGNAIPVATAQSLSTTVGIAVPVTLAGGDGDGNPLSFTVAIPPAHGALSGTAPNLLYTPAAGYTGPDSFTFKAADADAISSPAAVSLTVGAGGTGASTTSGGTTGSTSGSSSSGCGLGGGAALAAILALMVGASRRTPRT